MNQDASQLGDPWTTEQTTQSSKGAVVTEAARPQSDVTGVTVSSETKEASVGETFRVENEPQPAVSPASASTSREMDGHGSDVKPEASASVQTSTNPGSTATSAASSRVAPPTIPVVSR